MTQAAEREDESDIALRDARPADMAYIRDSWLRSYQRSYMEARDVYEASRSAQELFKALDGAPGAIDWDWQFVDPVAPSPKHTAWRALRVYYFREHLVAVNRALIRGRTIVACNEASTEQIYGWVCFTKDAVRNVVHYICVKSPFRRHGIGSDLLAVARHPHVRFAYTHRTGVTDKFLGPLVAVADFEPGAL